ncbi:MAG: DUF2442 domain-containing protein [Methylobacter sp.]
MLAVNEAQYSGNYCINLTFNNGRKGVANLKETIFHDQRPIFSALKDESNFKSFKVEHSTVVWSNELDLASEYLFYLAFKDDPDLQDQFKQWGYVL